MASNTSLQIWNSDMINTKYFYLIILSVFLQSFNAIFKKFAATTLDDVTLLAIISNTFYLLALICLFFQAIVWQQALIRYPLSVAYPFISLMNFFVLIASAVLFHEGITLSNILGLCLISVGITVLSRNVKERTVL